MRYISLRFIYLLTVIVCFRRTDGRW